MMEQLFTAFVVFFGSYNVAHHAVYLFTDRATPPAWVLLFRASMDLTGNVFRHFWMLDYFAGTSVWWVDVLFYTNYVHMFTHAIGIVWALANGKSLREHVMSFNEGKKRNAGYWIEWVVESHDMVFYGWVVVAIGATMSPWLLQLVVLLALATLVPNWPAKLAARGRA